MAAKTAPKTAPKTSTAFKRGDHVREVAPPHRAGYVTAVIGSGPGARFTVRFSGLPQAVFSASQLTRD